MSDDPTPAPSVPKPRAAGLALILGALGLAAGAYALWLAHGAAAQVAQLTSAQGQTESARSGDATRLAAGIEALKRQVDSESQRRSDLDALARSMREETLGLGERAGLLEDAVRKLAERRQDGDASLHLAEAEYLLRLGTERYLLFRDADAARQAYQLADAVLADLGDPVYAGVRQTLAAELAALEHSPQPDRTGLITRLDALEGTLGDLPLGDAPLRPVQAPVRTDWWSRVRAAFADTVRVRRVSTAEAAMLGPSQAALARQTLSLDLALAQGAIAASDDARARAVLAGAARRAERWLPREDARAKAFTDALASISQGLPATAPPAIGKALTELSNLRAAHNLTIEVRGKAKSGP